MKKLTVFDRYTTPEEWKRQALENSHKGKPKLKRWQFAAAVCTTCTVILCMVMLPYLNSAYQYANQPERPESEMYDSSTDKSIDQSNVKKRIVERMRSDFDCVVTGLILGGNENTSQITVYVTEKAEANVNASIFEGQILNLSIQPTGWLYTENSKTSGLVGIEKNIGNLAVFGMNFSNTDDMRDDTAEGYADLGAGNDPILDGVIETADLLTNNGEETYYDQTKDDIVINTFGQHMQLQPLITYETSSYNIKPMSAISIWYHDNSGSKEYNDVYRTVYIFRIENINGGAIKGEIENMEGNAVQIIMNSQNTETTFSAAADISGMNASIQYSVMKDIKDDTAVYLKAEVTPRSHAEYFTYADIAFYFGSNDIDNVIAADEVGDVLSECVIDYCYQDKNAELDNGKILPKIELDVPDNAGFSAECVRRSLLYDDDEKGEVRTVNYVIKLESNDPLNNMTANNRTSELEFNDEIWQMNIACADKENNVIDSEAYVISTEGFYNDTVQYITFDLKINTSDADIADITPILQFVQK